MASPSLLLSEDGFDIDGHETRRQSSNIFQRTRNFFQGIYSYICGEVLVGSPPMSPIERETLNPCEKLQRFGRIPWKLTVHAALVIATTVMVYLWSSNDALHIRHSLLHFHRIFLGVSGSIPAERRAEFTTTTELRNRIHDSISAFWAVGTDTEASFTDYSVCKGPLVFEISRRDMENSILLDRHDWEANPQFQHEMNHIDSSITRMSIRGIVHDVFRGDYWDQCLRWSIGTEFRYGGTGIVVGELDYELTECSKSGDTNNLVPGIVIGLALLSIILCTRAELGRLTRHGWWYFFNVCSNFVQIGASLSCMRLSRRMDVANRFAIIGVSAIMAWICVIRYLRYFHIYYALIRTLSRAVPKCMRFVTGVFPILIGYALLGNCLFYQSVMFSTISGSIATLFSLLNGDIIRDTFSDVEQLVPFWGHVYLYSFLCLFIYVVLHIFISIVEEAYFNSKSEYPISGSDAGNDVGTFEMTLEGTTTTTTPPSQSLPDSVGSYILERIISDLKLLEQNSEWESTYKQRIVNLIN